MGKIFGKPNYIPESKDGEIGPGNGLDGKGDKKPKDDPKPGGGLFDPDTEPGKSGKPGKSSKKPDKKSKNKYSKMSREEVEKKCMKNQAWCENYLKALKKEGRSGPDWLKSTKLTAEEEEQIKEQCGNDAKKCKTLKDEMMQKKHLFAIGARKGRGGSDMSNIGAIIIGSIIAVIVLIAAALLFYCLCCRKGDKDNSGTRKRRHSSIKSSSKSKGSRLKSKLKSSRSKRSSKLKRSSIKSKRKSLKSKSPKSGKSKRKSKK